MIRQLRRFGGFTLVEMLVAVSLLALIGVLGWRGLNNIQQASTRLTEMAASWQALALVGERIGRDVRQAMRLNGLQVDGQSLPAWQVVNTEKMAQIGFVRVGESDGLPTRLAYQWQEGQLDLLLWSAPDTSAPSRRYSLLSGIEHLEFAVLDRQGRWLDRWPAVPSQNLPRALRLRFDVVGLGRIERIFDVPAAD